jgi:hypothetical protein
MPSILKMERYIGYHLQDDVRALMHGRTRTHTRTHARANIHKYMLTHPGRH